MTLKSHQHLFLLMIITTLTVQIRYALRWMFKYELLFKAGIVSDVLKDFGVIQFLIIIFRLPSNSKVHEVSLYFLIPVELTEFYYQTVISSLQEVAAKA